MPLGTIALVTGIVASVISIGSAIFGWIGGAEKEKADEEAERIARETNTAILGRDKAQMMKQYEEQISDLEREGNEILGAQSAMAAKAGVSGGSVDVFDIETRQGLRRQVERIDAQKRYEMKRYNQLIAGELGEGQAAAKVMDREDEKLLNKRGYTLPTFGLG